MSKSLTEEYKVQMQKDIPDLWARIEASLPEKDLNINNNSEKVEADSNVVEFTAKDASKDVKKKKNKKNVKLRRMIYSMSGVAVAGIAIAILIPFISDDRISNSINAKADSVAQESSKSDRSSKSDKTPAAEAESADEAMEVSEYFTGVKGDSKLTFAPIESYRNEMNSATDAEAAAQDESVDSISPEAYEYSSEYTGVTYKYVSYDVVDDKYYYEVEVIKCDSDDDLVGHTLTIESDTRFMAHNDVLTNDLFLIEVVGEDIIYCITK